MRLFSSEKAIHHHTKETCTMKKFAQPILFVFAVAGLWELALVYQHQSTVKLNAGQHVDTRLAWRPIVVTSGEVNVIAESDHMFGLTTSPGGAWVDSQPKEPRLGWPSQEYYVAEMSITGPGELWLNDGEEVGVRVETKTNAALQYNPVDQKRMLSIVLGVLDVILWIIVVVNFVRFLYTRRDIEHFTATERIVWVGSLVILAVTVWWIGNTQVYPLMFEASGQLPIGEKEITTPPSTREVRISTPHSMSAGGCGKFVIQLTTGEPQTGVLQESRPGLTCGYQGEYYFLDWQDEPAGTIVVGEGTPTFVVRTDRLGRYYASTPGPDWFMMILTLIVAILITLVLSWFAWEDSRKKPATK